MTISLEQLLETKGQDGDVLVFRRGGGWNKNQTGRVIKGSQFWIISNIYDGNGLRRPKKL